MLPVPHGEFDCILNPIKNIDIGFGKGNNYKGSVVGGEVGVILDGRGREIAFSDNQEERIQQILSWSDETNEYIKEKTDV